MGEVPAFFFFNDFFFFFFFLIGSGLGREQFFGFYFGAVLGLHCCVSVCGLLL